jgi:hypothetical protein
MPVTCLPRLPHSTFSFSVSPSRWQIWLSAAATSLLQAMHHWEVSFTCRMLRRVSAIEDPVQFISALLQVRLIRTPLLLASAPSSGQQLMLQYVPLHGWLQLSGKAYAPPDHPHRPFLHTFYFQRVERARLHAARGQPSHGDAPGAAG